MICIFVFYDKSQGKQSIFAFSKKFKHVNVIKFDGDVTLIFEQGVQGITARRVKCKSMPKIIERLKNVDSITAIISVYVEHHPKFKWKPLSVNSCSVNSAKIAGIHAGLCLNPVQLYKNLLKYSGKSNFKILSSWMRTEDGIVWRSRHECTGCTTKTTSTAD